MRPIPAVRAVQRRLGELLRDRVAGADAGERGQQIWGKPGERWFSPGDPISSVHEDAAMFPGGVAALLLQSLHPLAMATARSRPSSGSDRGRDRRAAGVGPHDDRDARPGRAGSGGGTPGHRDGAMGAGGRGERATVRTAAR